MSEKQRTPMEEAALALVYHAAQLIKEGKSREAIIRELGRHGLSEDTAAAMLDRLDQSRVNVARRSGYRNAAFGLILCLGALIPLLGIGVEAPTGPGFGLALLILACGLLLFGRGLMQILGL